MCVQSGAADGDDLTAFDAKQFRLGSGGLLGGASLYGFFLAEELTRPGASRAGPHLGELARQLVGGGLDPGVERMALWQDIDEAARSLLLRRFTKKGVLIVDLNDQDACAVEASFAGIRGYVDNGRLARSNLLRFHSIALSPA
ncbi:hypothetical protein [Chenggangzhangella methanolivorans]|uniref:Uncharacterized protein n=1 Tax=Chenggangzhangella methanolivorans TaxID=1437009 RepID=A0A9E6R9D7_9HYPH|nr:hypothetical protein [Chenggangzhangella methanolivorans]QZO00524.1 hypothetical protein K6K41_01980 [Chenggangzhangella methanolivorans]